MNIDKILKRIKDLFKEHYVYEKNQLIDRIRAVKPYSNEQIYMAFNILLEGKYHLLTDMINRTGKLINIGDFYLFQPINIKDKKLTIFERKYPNKFKHQSIIIKNFKLDKSVKDNYNDGINHLANLKKEYKQSILYDSSKKLNAIEKRIWIKNSAAAIENLVVLNEMDRELLKEFCLEHLFDIKSINTKLNIINNLEKEKNSDDDFIKKLNIVVNKYKINEFLFLADYTIKKSKEYPSPPGEAWEAAKKELKISNDDSFFKFDEKTKTYKNYIGNDAINEFVSKFRKRSYVVDDKNIKKIDINKISSETPIGFMTIKSGSDRTIIFKTKNMIKRKGERINRGIECTSKGVKIQTRLDNINSLIINGINYPDDYKGKKYILEGKNDVSILLKNGVKKKIDSINNTQLCVELEFLLRYLDKIKYNGKKYFFSTIEDVFCGRISKIEKNYI